MLLALRNLYAEGVDGGLGMSSSLAPDTAMDAKGLLKMAIRRKKKSSLSRKSPTRSRNRWNNLFVLRFLHEEGILMTKRYKINLL
jgi:hypothetical protein